MTVEAVTIAEAKVFSLDRKVTVAGVVSVIMLAASLLGVYMKTNERISAVEMALTYQKGVNDQLKESQKDIKADNTRSIDEVKGSIDKLSNKIDKLLERK